MTDNLPAEQKDSPVYQQALELKKFGTAKLSNIERYQVAKLAVAYGLDPFLRHIEVLGGKPYITVAGLLHNAANSGLLDGLETFVILGEDRKGMIDDLDLPPDTIIFEALVYKQGCSHPFTGYGFASKADVNLQGKRAKDIAAMAENRAVSRAIRKGWAVGITTLEELSNVQTDDSQDVVIELEPEEVQDQAIVKSLQTLESILGLNKAQTNAWFKKELDGDPDKLIDYIKKNTPPEDFELKGDE